MNAMELPLQDTASGVWRQNGPSKFHSIIGGLKHADQQPISPPHPLVQPPWPRNTKNSTATTRKMPFLPR